MDRVGNHAGVVLLHTRKYLQRLVPVLALGTHVQQAGEGCRLRVEIGAANDICYLPCTASLASRCIAQEDLGLQILC